MNNKIEEITSSLLEHIYKARKEALKQCIDANTIIIDEDLAKVEGFYCNGGIYPTMIMGLEVHYRKNMAKDLGCNFAISHVTNPLAKYSDEELLNELARREEARKEDEDETSTNTN